MNIPVPGDYELHLNNDLALVFAVVYVMSTLEVAARSRRSLRVLAFAAGAFVAASVVGIGCAIAYYEYGWWL